MVLFVGIAIISFWISPTSSFLVKYFLKCKGSAWAPAFAGAHASGRAGQHFDNLRCSCPIWHALNLKVMPRVQYEHGIIKVMI